MLHRNNYLILSSLIALANLPRTGKGSIMAKITRKLNDIQLKQRGPKRRADCGQERRRRVDLHIVGGRHPSMGTPLNPIAGRRE
jgi:hypothetical protein